MTDSFLDNAGGFTPVPDKLVRDYGFEVAYVWGKVWRYCQMQNGACTASHETIAKRAGMSRRTLIDKLNILIEAGYIEDKTPDLKNKPHTYCTKKGEAKITSTMQISHTESDIATETHKDTASSTDVSMRTLHSDDADNAQSDPSTMQNLHTEDAGIAQPAEPTMQNLHPKRVSSSSSIESNLIKESLKVLSPPQKLFLALADLCHIELRAASEKQKGQLGKASKALVNLVTDLDQFKAKFPVYWAAMDWRGQKGQSPDPPQIQESYGDYCHWIQNGAPTQARKGQPTNGTHQSNSRKGIKALEETGESLRQNRTTDTSTREYVYPDGHREPIPPVPRVPRRGLLPS